MVTRTTSPVQIAGVSLVCQYPTVQHGLDVTFTQYRFLVAA